MLASQVPRLCSRSEDPGKHQNLCKFPRVQYPLLGTGDSGNCNSSTGPGQACEHEVLGPCMDL